MMMLEFLSFLQDQDIRVWADGDRLRISCPQGKLTAELRSTLVARKAEILAFLRTATVEALPIGRSPRDGDLPLTFCQERMWDQDRAAPGNPAYNVARAFRLTGRLDAVAVERSINELVRRHETLRTSFPTMDGRPVQSIAPGKWLDLPVIDLGALSQEDRTNEAERLVSAEVRQNFNLSRGPLVSSLLLRLGQNDHTLVLTRHHIVTDAWSTRLLLREFSSLYGAFASGKPSPLPAVALQYADYALWQRGWSKGAALQGHLSYWERQLDELAPLRELPADGPRLPKGTRIGARQGVELPGHLATATQALSRQEGVTPFMTYLAILQTWLHYQTGAEDIVVGSPFTNRTRAETEGIVGLVANFLVLRTDLGGNPTFQELLQRVRVVALGATAHQELPFAKIFAELYPNRDLDLEPPFQVFFNAPNLGNQGLRIPGLRVEPLTLPQLPPRFDLTVYVRERDGRTNLEVSYDAGLFSRTQIAAFVGEFEYLLQTVIHAPELDIQALLRRLDHRRAPLTNGRPVPEIAAHRAKETPAERKA